MCFYNDDYDWVAEVCDIKDGPATAPCRCIECRQPIGLGDWCRTIHHQEHEECTKCYEHGDDAEFDDDVNFIPCDGNHHYGEMWDGVQCRDCVNLLAAIAAVEEEEGCPPHARQPSYGGLDEEVTEDGDSLRKYLERAVAMFPGIEQAQIFIRLSTARLG